MPPIKSNFSYTPVEATDVPPIVWEVAFDNYLISRKQFPIDLAQQENMLRTLAGDIGVGTDVAPKLLEALSERCKVLRRWWGLQKVPEILRCLEHELRATPSKLVVYACSRAVISELRDGLIGYGAALLYAGTPMEKRNAIVKNFNERPKYRVLVCAMDAAKLALHLTATDRVRVAELSWFNDSNVQALMRVANHRQDQDVDIRFYGLKGTLDEKITRALGVMARRGVTGFVADEQHTPPIVDAALT